MDIEVVDELHRDLLAIVGRDFPLRHLDQQSKVVFEYAILLIEVDVGSSDVIGVLSHLDGIEDPQVLYLVVADAVGKMKGVFFFIGFDASDEVHIGIGRHLKYKLSHLFSNLDAQKLFIPFLLQKLVLLSEGLTDKFDLDVSQPKEQIFSYQVFVLLSETVDHIFDVPRGVLYYKGFSDVGQIARWEMLVGVVVLLNAGQKVVVSYVHRTTFV